MKGSVLFERDRGYWVVNWPEKGKVHKVRWYKKDRMYHKKYAEACLRDIQRDYENGLAGNGSFNIDRYKGKVLYTDVIELFENWLEIIQERRKPATYKGYKSYFKNWIKPFFEQNSIMLHEIQLDTLDKLLSSIKLEPKGRYNVMAAFHRFMVYIKRSRKIQALPDFPEKEDYDLVEPTIKWLPEERQMKIINQIPEEHRPIFLWLKYHLRRPAEACALHREDYDPIANVFIIRRSISARKLVERTKTNAEHVIPCHSIFEDTAKALHRNPGQFFFRNPLGRMKGKRYGGYTLNRIWKKACTKVGENIDMYSGLKHSSCSQYVNEKGMSLSELQIITDHARLESVRKYARVEVARKRELMERGSVISFPKPTPSHFGEEIS